MDEIGMIPLRQPITPRRTRVLPTSLAATELAPSIDGELIGAQMPGHVSHFQDGSTEGEYLQYRIVDIAAVGSRWHPHTYMYRQASNRAMHPLYMLVSSTTKPSLSLVPSAI
jgi:hypothetical protein